MSRVFACLIVALSLGAAEPAIPDKLVVLTFDDSVKSHATFVAPALKKLGFGATFFITEGFTFTTNKQLYMTWDEIRGLHDQGFEIGNHTRHHRGVNKQTAAEIEADVAHIEAQCRAHGIPKPVTFCYPGYATNPAAVKVLQGMGYVLARAGGKRAFKPASDQPLLAPQAFDSKPHVTFEDFKKAVGEAGDGRIPILTFHGVPDKHHPWVNTSQEAFMRYMTYLKDNGYTVVALRDLRRYLPAKDKGD